MLKAMMWRTKMTVDTGAGGAVLYFHRTGRLRVLHSVL